MTFVVPYCGTRWRKPQLTRLCEAQNWRCCYCGIRMEFGSITSRDAASVEHIIPKVAGGLENWENLAAACMLCNNSRGSMRWHKYFQLVQWKGRVKAAAYAIRVRTKIRSRAAPPPWKETVAFLKNSADDR